MADRAKWDLRGPVRTLEVHRTFGDKPDQSIVEFRPDGAIARNWRQYSNGSETTETFSYNPAGQLASRQFESSAGQSTLWIYEYDSLGRLARQFRRDASGNEHNVDIYSYDSAGHMTKVHRASQATNYGYSVDGSEAFYSGPNAATITTHHDAAGRPTETLFHDADGALVSRVDFRYDNAGNLIEETQTRTTWPFPELLSKLTPKQSEIIQSVLSGPIKQCRHRYNALGQRIETLRSTFGSLASDRVTMQYNPHGDLAIETTRHQSREYGFDDQGQPVDRPGPHCYSETRFLYEYDPRGNWISKIAQGRADEHSDFSPGHSERRTVAYFDNL
jgi:YD repeat-containing protein